jgi:hypothetical protein
LKFVKPAQLQWKRHNQILIFMFPGLLPRPGNKAP